jgi:hypothetical protein
MRRAHAGMRWVTTAPLYSTRSWGAWRGDPELGELGELSELGELGELGELALASAGRHSSKTRREA